MNLSAYDNVENVLDRTKTWVLVKSKELLSREIKKRRYYTLTKRFNITSGLYEYFLVLLDDRFPSNVCKLSHIDNYGRLKLSIKSIWGITMLSSLKYDTNIGIEHIEHTDDGDIYRLDI